MRSKLVRGLPRSNISCTIHLLLLGVLLLTIFSILLLAATPPFSRDALTHHLYVPKLWLQQGSFDPISYITFSYYPMNLDLLYAIPLALGNDIIPKYIHFVFALCTAWLIYDYLKARLNRNFALLGAIFFLTLPIIVKLSITVYVDLGVVFFTTASLLTLFKWAEYQKLRYMILAGFFCGLAAGTKYNALVAVFLLTLLTPIIYIRLGKSNNRHTSLKALAYGFIFLVVTLATFSPWMARNYSETGNPIYPLYNKLFNPPETTDISYQPNDSGSTNLVSKTKDITQTIFTRRSSTLASRKVLYQETWWQSLLLPVRYFFEGQDDDPRYFDGKLSPFLLLLMFIPLYKPDYSSRTKREIYFLFAFGWLFFFFTFFQEALRIRWIGAALPAFVILATFGIHNLSAKLKETRGSAVSNRLISLLVIIALAYNGLYIFQQFKRIEPLTFIFGDISREQYLTKRLPEYPIIKFANENLGSGTRILAIYGGYRGYYYDHPVIFEPDGKRFRIGTLTEKSSAPAEISDGLKQPGFTHLVIRFDLFTTMANQNLDKEKIGLLNEFLTGYTSQLARNDHYGLFELK